MAYLNFAYFPKVGPFRAQVAPLLRGGYMPATTGYDGTRDIGSGGLRRVALRNKTAASLDHSPCREQVAPLLRAIYMPATTGRDGTRDIESGGLRRVVPRNKIAANLHHSPREIPWRGPMALVANRSGQEP
jgi:hypothetical protein